MVARNYLLAVQFILLVAPSHAARQNTGRCEKLLHQLILSRQSLSETELG